MVSAEDNIKADIQGSAGVGIFPVMVWDMTIENPWTDAADQYERFVPDCGASAIYMIGKK